MKAKEIKEKSKKELKEMLPELRKELIKLESQVATGTMLESPGRVKKIKKNIARILTKLNQNE